MNNKENISETFNYCYEDKFDIEDKYPVKPFFIKRNAL